MKNIELTNINNASDYELIHNFLIKLNKDDKNYVHWNWARFEWMILHPDFNENLINSIGVWKDNNEVVGLAVYDMYFGEAFCGVLPEYKELYPEIIAYAFEHLKDENGLGIAINDENLYEVQEAIKQGFVKTEQDETMLIIDLSEKLDSTLPKGFAFKELSPTKDIYEFRWLMWQGFNHGNDKEEFERTEKLIPVSSKYSSDYLSVSVVYKNGINVGYTNVWYIKDVDYAYVEPVCVIPSYRGKNIGKAVVREALNRARELGAKKGYVISNNEFYKKVGFTFDKHYSFYWRKK